MARTRAGTSRLAADAGDERLVDLEVVQREPLEVAQRAVADAEVVDGEIDAELLELLEPPDRRLGVLHQRRLGDLERQAGRRQAGGSERLRDLVRKSGLAELDAGDVDRDLQVPNGRVVRLPARRLLAGGPQDPAAERADLAGLLGERR